MNFITELASDIAEQIKHQTEVSTQFDLAVRLVHPCQRLNDKEQFIAAVLALYKVSSPTIKREISIYIENLKQVLDFIESCDKKSEQDIPKLIPMENPLGLMTRWIKIKGQINVEDGSKRKIVN